MLLTVIINVIDNALKYSNEEKMVTIKIINDDDNILFMIVDEGIGIPQDERQQIGRRFFRASNTRAATGSGLGLYSSIRLLEYHRGTLTLTPRNPDGTDGTIAMISLPLPGPFLIPSLAVKNSTVLSEGV